MEWEIFKSDINWGAGDVCLSPVKAVGCFHLLVDPLSCWRDIVQCLAAPCGLSVVLQLTFEMVWRTRA